VPGVCQIPVTAEPRVPPNRVSADIFHGGSNFVLMLGGCVLTRGSAEQCLWQLDFGVGRCFWIFAVYRFSFWPDVLVFLSSLCLLYPFGAVIVVFCLALYSIFAAAVNCTWHCSASVNFALPGHSLLLLFLKML
jgi:hypothetical protein